MLRTGLEEEQSYNHVHEANDREIIAGRAKECYLSGMEVEFFPCDLDTLSVTLQNGKMFSSGKHVL